VTLCFPVTFIIVWRCLKELSHWFQWSVEVPCVVCNLCLYLWVTMLEKAPVLPVNLMRPNSMLQSFDHYSLRVLGLTLMRFLVESESVLPSLLLCAALVVEVVLLLSFFLSHCWCKYRRRIFVFSVVITCSSCGSG